LATMSCNILWENSPSNIHSTDVFMHLTGQMPVMERTYQVTLFSEGVYKSCNKYTCLAAYLTFAATA
jgi:hypothetical protein